MSSLTPFEELEIKKGSTALTLHAKQAESANLKAQIKKFLADGGRIEQAVCVPFVPKFEITPEGKPKPKPKAPQTVRRNREQEEQSEALRTKILSFAREYGRPFLPITVAKNLDISCQKACYHILALQMDGRVESAGLLGRSPLYEVVK